MSDAPISTAQAAQRTVRRTDGPCGPLNQLRPAHLLWWEAAILLRKAGIVLIATLVQSATLQLVLLGLLALLALQAHMSAQPYALVSFNQLETMSLFAALVTALLSFLLLADFGDSSTAAGPAAAAELQLSGAHTDTANTAGNELAVTVLLLLVNAAVLLPAAVVAGRLHCSRAANAARGVMDNRRRRVIPQVAASASAPSSQTKLTSGVPTSPSAQQVARRHDNSMRSAELEPESSKSAAGVASLLPQNSSSAAAATATADCTVTASPLLQSATALRSPRFQPVSCSTATATLPLRDNAELASSSATQFAPVRYNKALSSMTAVDSAADASAVAAGVLDVGDACYAASGAAALAVDGSGGTARDAARPAACKGGRASFAAVSTRRSSLGASAAAAAAAVTSAMPAGRDHTLGSAGGGRSIRLLQPVPPSQHRRRNTCTAVNASASGSDAHAPAPSGSNPEDLLAQVANPLHRA